jgi:hypothetical protein
VNIVNIDTLVEDLAAKIDFENRGVASCARKTFSNKTFATLTFSDQCSNQLSEQLIAQLLSIGADHVTLIAKESCRKPHAAGTETVCLRFVPAHAIATISFDASDSGAMSASQVLLSQALQPHAGRQISIETMLGTQAMQGGKLDAISGEWIRASAGLHSLASIRSILVHDVLGQGNESHYR